jgi:hypothetical protein
MESYDPLKTPNPKDWAALDEAERIILVEDFHRRARVQLPNRRLHAAFHAVVENQIAEGSSLPVQDTLARLMSEGLDRHDAIHAIGSVLAGSMYDIIKGTAPEDPNPDYFNELKALTADEWRIRETSVSGSCSVLE